MSRNVHDAPENSTARTFPSPSITSGEIFFYFILGIISCHFT